MLPKHKHGSIAYGKTITTEDMLAILPSKLPFCAYSICVDEVAVEGDIVPSLVGGPSPVLYGFAWSMQVFLKFKVKVICLPFAGSHKLVPSTGCRSVPFGSLSPCIVGYPTVTHLGLHLVPFTVFVCSFASNHGNGQKGGPESEVAHKWARWLHNPCRLGDPHRFIVGGRIISGPQVGKVATLPLPPGGSPTLQGGGQY